MCNLLVSLMLFSQLSITYSTSEFIDIQNGQVLTGQRKGDEAACEVTFSIENAHYKAQINGGGLTVMLVKNEAKNPIYKLVPEYGFIFKCTGLVVMPFANGNTFLVWKWCKSHYCPIENGAVIFNITNKQAFRLEFEEEKGLALSKELSDPANSELRSWLLKWWQEWPGRNIPEKDIIYRQFAK
jgi:hypothetical protein